MSENTQDIVGEEFDKLFEAAKSKRGTAGRLDKLSPVHQLFIDDYSTTFLPYAPSATGKPLSKNSQDSYKSGLVSAFLKIRRGEKLTSDENSYTRMFEKYMDLVREFNEIDEDVDEDINES